MRQLAYLVLAIWGLTTFSGCTKHAAPTSSKAPLFSVLPRSSAAAPAQSHGGPVPTPREPVVDVLHGTRIEDPYRWLEDGSSERVANWTALQTKYLRQVIDPVVKRAGLERDLERLVRIGRLGMPKPIGLRNGAWRYFYTKMDSRQDQPVLYYRDSLNGTDRVLVDINTLSKDGTVALDWYFPSEDGRFVAYGLSEHGDEQSVLHVLEIKPDGSSGERPDTIPRTRHESLVWKPDSSGFFYTRYPSKGAVPPGEEYYHRAVYEHRLGTDATKDPKIFGEGLPMTHAPSVALSPDGRWLMVTVTQGWTKTELYLRDLQNKKDSKFASIAVGTEARYWPTMLNDRIVVFTTDGAPRGRIMVVDPKQPDRGRWKELIAEGPDALVDVEVVGGQILTTYLHNASSLVRWFGLDGKPAGDLSLPMLGTASLSGARNGSEVFLGFTSFAVPHDVYRVALNGKTKGQRELWQRVQGPLDPDAFGVQQQWAVSKDGTQVPYFVVHRKGIALDGTGAALLTGYGGFNVPSQPRFLGPSGVLLDRGGVYVLANLRGGGEFGEAWHKAGMFEKKQNVFDDMIAVSESVVSNRIAARDRLGFIGGSNGGLLAGAMLTQRPDLFRVVIARVPLLDMLRYHHFLMAKQWVTEYGSAEDPRLFPALAAYSPYQRVRESVAYPATMLVAAESDGRVDPMHARKMAAAMQHATSSSEPIVLRIESKAGHGVGKPVSKQLDEYSDLYAFALWKLGLLN